MIDDKCTEQIIGCAYQVYNRMGSGFLEKVYENCLAIELQQAGFRVSQQVPIPVFYQGVQVGDFFADLLVDGHLILELKAVEHVLPLHETQLVNYLTATGLDVGLLINFGYDKVHVKRKYRQYRPKKV